MTIDDDLEIACVLSEKIECPLLRMEQLKSLIRKMQIERKSNRDTIKRLMNRVDTLELHLKKSNEKEWRKINESNDDR